MRQQEYIPQPSQVPPKWLRCHGQQLLKMIRAALTWLDENHQHVNALNVFPVPDGDTGTNMLLTMQSAYARIEQSDDMHAGKVMGQIAQGALMGARGNSGVILSQIWRGLAQSLANKETFDAQDLAAAFKEAADTAYNGVMRPVEGTILTVIRESAAEAADAASKSPDLRFLLERVLERSQQSLERTPDLLPILKQAGVVDSGGQGLVYLFEGMLRYLYGEMPRVRQHGLQPTVSLPPAQAHVLPEGGQLENPYDVQFMLMGEDLDVTVIRNRIDAMGDSTVVVGDDRAIKVHIHVKDPGEPLSYGISLGHVTDVVVENMQMQMEDFIAEAQDPGPADRVPEIAVAPGQIAVVAVAAGDGLAQVFRSLGVASIVEGGQTNNPSTEEIFQAIEDVPTDRVIVLPNNKNVILAAEAARKLSAKEVAIVPTRTVPQGIGALLCHSPDGDLDETAEAMCEAASQIVTGEMTVATRSVTLDGVSVQQGEYIGLVDGRLAASGPVLDDVLLQVLAAMKIESREILTIYYGQDISPDEAAAKGDDIVSHFPNIEVELLAGGQAHYFYIIGAE